MATFNDTRDNITASEPQIIEADKRAREASAPYPPAYPFPVFGRNRSTWSECQCEKCTTRTPRDEVFGNAAEVS